MDTMEKLEKQVMILQQQLDSLSQQVAKLLEPLPATGLSLNQAIKQSIRQGRNHQDAAVIGINRHRALFREDKK